MTAPKFSASISLGNVITLFGLAVPGLLLLGALNTSVDANSDRVEKLEDKMSVVEKDTHTLPVELKNLAEDMDEIKDQLDANNRLIRDLFRTRTGGNTHE